MGRAQLFRLFPHSTNLLFPAEKRGAQFRLVASLKRHLARMAGRQSSDARRTGMVHVEREALRGRLVEDGRAVVQRT